MQTRSNKKRQSLYQTQVNEQSEQDISNENNLPLQFELLDKLNQQNGFNSKQRNTQLVNQDYLWNGNVKKDQSSKKQVRYSQYASSLNDNHEYKKSVALQNNIINTLDALKLEDNKNSGDIKEIKIQLGSFIQKQDINIDDYLSNFEGKIKLGSGHYSEVFKIKNKEKDIFRAMKIINKKMIPFNEKEALLREVQILKKLDHPNILKLYEFLEDEQNYYLITELCDGKELFDVIYDNCESLSEKDIASIIQQILQALTYAHSNKIMHRDIKPENIMVQQDMKNNFIIKLVDWGIGCDFSTSDSTQTTKCGTPYYAAPEIFKKKYNEKCDIWSTGVILYTLLVQEIPFRGDSTTEIISNVIKGQYDMKGDDWDKISDDVKDLVKKMFCYNYENRLSAEECLQHYWFKQFLSQKPNMSTLKVNLSKLQNFKAKSSLQKAAMSFIVSHLISEKDKEQFSETFKLLDENGDGQLSKAEIMNGYKKVWKKGITDQEINKIFDQIDVNQSGFIDYTEFITAAIDASVFTEQEKLKEAFSLFDKDGDGYITQVEIKNVLGKGMELDEETWQKIVAEVDENGDGQISFEEFKKIMQSIVKQNQKPKRKYSRKKSNVMMVDENNKDSLTQ